jgi:putative Ca2+/H+ antiporter (TMEM165/GDT1 family)
LNSPLSAYWKPKIIKQNFYNSTVEYPAMDFVPVISTLVLIFLSELGDKTQLAVISLSANHKWSHVFIGAMLAFLAVDGISVAVGGPLLALLPLQYVQVVAGAVFIFFGVFPLLRKSSDQLKPSKVGAFPILTCFSLIALMELGDKSQILAITLAAESPPVLVLLGLIIALAMLTILGVFLGAKLQSKLPMKWLKIGTSALFIIIGILSILGALFHFAIL